MPKQTAFVLIREGGKRLCGRDTGAKTHYPEEGSLFEMRGLCAKANDAALILRLLRLKKQAVLGILNR
jgi:hypothetical protein